MEKVENDQKCSTNWRRRTKRKKDLKTEEEEKEEKKEKRQRGELYQ